MLTLPQALARLDGQLSDRNGWIALRGICTCLGLPQDRTLARLLLKPIPAHLKTSSLRFNRHATESAIHRDALPILRETLLAHPELFCAETPAAPPPKVTPRALYTPLPSPYGWIVERVGTEEHYREHPGEQAVLKQIRRERAFQLGAKLNPLYVDLTQIAGELTKAGLTYRGEKWTPALIDEAEERDYSFRRAHGLPQPKEEVWQRKR